MYDFVTRGTVKPFSEDLMICDVGNILSLYERMGNNTVPSWQTQAMTYYTPRFQEYSTLYINEAQNTQ